MRIIRKELANGGNVPEDVPAFFAEVVARAELAVLLEVVELLRLNAQDFGGRRSAFPGRCLLERGLNDFGGVAVFQLFKDVETGLPVGVKDLC